jgi:hypothetical protein
MAPYFCFIIGPVTAGRAVIGIKFGRSIDMRTAFHLVRQGLVVLTAI